MKAKNNKLLTIKYIHLFLVYALFSVIINMSRTFNTEALNSDTIKVGNDTLIVSESQEVGIGTIAPEYKLEIRSDSANGLRISREGTANQEISLVFEDGGTNLNNGNKFEIKSFGGGLSLYSDSNERIRIAQDGNVGINDASPIAVDDFGSVAVTVGDNSGGTLCLRHSSLPSANFRVKFIASKNGNLVFGRTTSDGTQTNAQVQIDQVGTMSLIEGSPVFKIYKSSSVTNSLSAGYSWLNLGNNGANDIICGKNSLGGYLRIFVNNTNDVESNNSSDGIEALSVETSAIRVGASHNLTFGNTYKQSITFHGTEYGIGSQTNGLYYRIASNGRFSWYAGGSHSNNEGGAGSGGITLMSLFNNGLGINCIPAHRLDVDGDINSRAAYRGTVQRGIYGSLSIEGIINGYAGIDFTDVNTTFMVGTDSTCGITRNDAWVWYFNGAGSLVAGTVPWSRLTSIPTNAVGNRTISTANPTGGSNGDIWYKI